MAQLTRFTRLFRTNIQPTCVQAQFMSSKGNTAAATLPTTRPEGPWHKDYNPSLEDQSFIFDGQTIGFAEYGTRTGTPAILCHGAPGSRYDGIVYHDSAKKLDVRIICPDRPGHGLSTFVPDRKLVDYPSGISALAKHLKLGPYHVFGQSGGGPYAIACARLLPEDELLNTTVIAGMGPPELITIRQAGWYTTIALWMHIHAPTLLKRILNLIITPESVRNDQKLLDLMDMVFRWLPAGTREEMKDLGKPEIQRELVVHLQCMFAQGWDGTIRDGQIYASPWGFDAEEVKRKVQLIYGGKDWRTPIGFGRWYRDNLANATLIEYEDATHISIGDRADEMLAYATGKEDRWRAMQANDETKKEQEKGSTVDADRAVGPRQTHSPPA